jgi:hypothetical protein
VLPAANIGGNNYISVGNDGTYNYYIIAKYSGAIAAGGTGDAGAVAGGLTVNQALQLDSKLDDGNPTTGIVQSLAQTTEPTPGTLGGGVAGGGAGACYNSTAPVAYAAGNLNIAECNIEIKTSF